MKALIQFIAILIITAVIISVYSFADYELKIGDYTVKKSGIKKYILFSDTIESPAVLNFEHLEDSAETETVVTDTASQKILLIGDSMLEGLMLRLRDYTEYNGHTMKTVIWYSSSSLWYGTSDTLSYFIKQEKPTYVILVLGANELFIRDIKNKRKKYVNKIVAQMDTIPFIWVGPPNWKDDTGINDLILDAVGKGRYFESKKLKYNRMKDGAHPTRASAVSWMDSIAVWIANESNYRIKMDMPDKRYKVSPNATLLQPKK